MQHRRRGAWVLPCLRGRGRPAFPLCCIPNFRAGSQQREAQPPLRSHLDWPGVCGCPTPLTSPLAHSWWAGQNGTCPPLCASSSGCTAILDCTAQSMISIMLLSPTILGRAQEPHGCVVTWGRETWSLGIVPFASCAGTRYRRNGSAQLERGCFPL